MIKTTKRNAFITLLTALFLLITCSLAVPAGLNAHKNSNYSALENEPVQLCFDDQDIKEA